LENKHEAYEHNLKLYNESIRKDLDITLTSSIPTQKNLMKTILWLNSSIIGLSIASVSKEMSIWYIAVPFILSFFAILTILFALKDGRVKYFGTPSIESIENIDPNEYEKVQGLIEMNNSFQIAFNNNSELIKKRATKIALATTKTILSIVSIPILLGLFYFNNQNLMKGGKDMAENDNNPTSSSTRPKMSSATSKPAAMMSTNSSVDLEHLIECNNRQGTIREPIQKSRKEPATQDKKDK
jgi:hypothetical protein